jgi:hypothetical protein
MALSQMQIGCLPGSQMGFTSIQCEPVGTAADMEPAQCRQVPRPLLNGSRLTQLMIERGVGATRRPLKIALEDA